MIPDFTEHKLPITICKHNVYVYIYIANCVRHVMYVCITGVEHIITDYYLEMFQLFFTLDKKKKNHLMMVMVMMMMMMMMMMIMMIQFIKCILTHSLLALAPIYKLYTHRFMSSFKMVFLF